MKSKILGIFFIIFGGIMSFSQCNKTDDIANKRIKFINEGFGFEYQEDEIINYELFLLRHNNPIKILEYDLGTELYDIEYEIVYDSIIAKFLTCKYGKVLGTDYKDILLEIKSKDNKNYLYNIRHGLTMNELEKIIGKVELGEKFIIDKKIYNDIILSNENKKVQILLSEDKIVEIIWFIKWNSKYDEEE